MKNANSESSKRIKQKKKKVKIIRLEHSNTITAEIAYEKYYKRIKMLSRGV